MLWWRLVASFRRRDSSQRPDRRRHTSRCQACVGSCTFGSAVRDLSEPNRQSSDTSQRSGKMRSPKVIIGDLALLVVELLPPYSNSRRPQRVYCCSSQVATTAVCTGSDPVSRALASSHSSLPASSLALLLRSPTFAIAEARILIF